MIASATDATAGTAAAVVMLAATVVLAPAGVECWQTGWRCHDVNDIRTSRDRSALDQTRTLKDAATGWADTMARAGVLRHSGAVSGGETVGVGPDWATVLAAFLRSDRHRPILLDRDWTRVGIGAVRDGERVWVVVRFR